METKATKYKRRRYGADVVVYTTEGGNFCTILDKDYPLKAWDMAGRLISRQLSMREMYYLFKQSNVSEEAQKQFYIDMEIIVKKEAPKSASDELFNLDYQWNLYLERVGLKGKKLAANQYREMKSTFFGACGQLLIMLRDDVGGMEDQEALKVMKSLMDQVGNYFLKVNGRGN